jgi:glycosyltransferase involved in cell wall biosynthesis
MKIALIGPGIMPIPPPGWGAVEILIWDYYNELIKQGHDVTIINRIRKTSSEQLTPFSGYCQSIINEVNDGKYDFVHLHYDCMYHIMPHIRCKNKGITSHYPYIDQLEKHIPDGYRQIFNNIIKNDETTIFALSQKDYNTFHRFCANKNKLHIILNGADSNLIQVNETGAFKDKSIYIGKIEPRKQQFKYKAIPELDFYGRCDHAEFAKLPNYKGEVNGHENMMKIMSEYGNLVLLSTGENGTPLVIKEALMAGIPIVTNKYSANDLDTSLPFIDIIPDDKFDDLVYIENTIKQNLKKSVMRNEIRQYAMDNFSWKKLVKYYVEQISK